MRVLAGGLILIAIACAMIVWTRGGDVAIQRNIVYGNAGTVELHLDFAQPSSGDGPFPLVVCIHGGAWRSGDKASYGATMKALAARGYASASVEYRLAPAHKFPAQVEDVKCAVRFLRANAARFKIDPDRIAALGDSAGGHLALMLGFTEASDGLEGNGGWAEQKSKVRAVVNYYGPTDLTAPDVPWMQGQVTQAEYFLGTKDPKDEIVARASPVHYLDAGDAPVLSVHGALDQTVPVSQARLLQKRLNELGVKNQLEVIEDAGHGWNDESGPRVFELTVKFLDENLKR